jgi:uncharacterized protein YgiM (DUF1202 family)
MRSRLVVALSALMLIATAAYADTVYVQAKSAKLRDGKTSLDREVATVRFGDALEVLKTDGSWLQVRTANGARGWIFVNKTTTTKPDKQDDELAALGRSVRGKEASQTTASAGARGLDKVSEAYANRSGIPKAYRDAVDRMTAYQVGDQEVEDFLKKGALGEYAK